MDRGVTDRESTAETIKGEQSSDGPVADRGWQAYTPRMDVNVAITPWAR